MQLYFMACFLVTLVTKVQYCMCGVGLHLPVNLYFVALSLVSIDMNLFIFSYAIIILC